jgi:hypothetical protein
MAKNRSSKLDKTGGPGAAKQEWADPEIDWRPVGKATFEFGIAHDDGPADVRARPLESAFSLAAFRKSISVHESPVNRLKDAELAEVTTGALSKKQLARILQEESGADKTEIDRDSGTFSFSFFHNGVFGGRPWAILRVATEVKIDPQIEAEALFNKAGIVRIRDEDAETNAKLWAAVRRATGLVWRQYMLTAFDRAVSNRMVLLYGRPQNILANFKRLPADAWPLLDVKNWETGVAVAPDGTAYWSIHAQPSAVRLAAGPNAPLQPIIKRVRGRKPVKLMLVVQNMMDDLREGRITQIELAELLEKDLAHKYQASRTTVRDARNQVMLNSTSDK